MDKALVFFEKVAPYLKDPLVLGGFVLFLASGVLYYLIRSGIIPTVKQTTGGRIILTALRYGFVLALLIIVFGFGLRFYETHLAAGLRVDPNAIVEKLESSHQERVASLKQETEDWKKQAQAAVQALANLLNQKDAPPGINKALALLKQGNPKAAEKIFQGIEVKKTAQGQAAYKQAAAAARHIGALAFLHNTRKAFGPTAGQPSSTRTTCRVGICLDSF